MSYWSHNAGWRSSSLYQFEKLGDPGKYYDPLVWSGGQLDLTGSRFGYGAVGRTGSAFVTTVLTANNGVSFTDSEIDAVIENKKITEVSIMKVSGSTLVGGKLVFYKRQQ